MPKISLIEQLHTSKPVIVLNNYMKHLVFAVRHIMTGRKKVENEFDFGMKGKKERNGKIDKEALRQTVAKKPEAFLSEYAEQCIVI